MTVGNRRKEKETGEAETICEELGPVCTLNHQFMSVKDITKSAAITLYGADLQELPTSIFSLQFEVCGSWDVWERMDCRVGGKSKEGVMSWALRQQGGLSKEQCPCDLGTKYTLQSRHTISANTKPEATYTSHTHTNTHTVHPRCKHASSLFRFAKDKYSMEIATVSTLFLMQTHSYLSQHFRFHTHVDLIPKSIKLIWFLWLWKWSLYCIVPCCVFWYQCSRAWLQDRTGCWV